MSIKHPVDQKEIDEHLKLQEEIFVPSRYEFLKAHKGLRPGCLHGIISTTGAGKSTLTKALIVEAATHHKVMVWLSEETVKEYQALISKMDQRVLANIVFVEEKEIPEEIKRNQSDFFEYFNQMVEESDPWIVFIDNVTTSAFYNMRYGLAGQNRSAEFLKNFPKLTGKAVFYVGHTDSKVHDNFKNVITPEMIRGSKELPLATEYFYCFQKFIANDQIFTLLRVAKHRHHKDAAGWYALVFEKDFYVADVKAPFSTVNKIFKKRDYLGKYQKKDQ